MLTNREYKLLKKIQESRVSRVEDLWPWEIKTFRDMYRKGYVGLETKSSEQQFEYGEVMLDENASGEPDSTKYGVKPKLEPGPARVFTPAFIRSSFGSALFGFLLGVFFYLLANHVLMFL